MHMRRILIADFVEEQGNKAFVIVDSVLNLFGADFRANRIAANDEKTY